MINFVHANYIFFKTQPTTESYFLLLPLFANFVLPVYDQKGVFAVVKNPAGDDD